MAYGFSTGSFATIFSVERVKDTITKCNVAISHKDKNTGEYVGDFNGVVSFIGTAAASKAAKLKEKDKIRLGDVTVTSNTVTNTYNGEERKVRYYNFTCFSFKTQAEVDAEREQGGSQTSQHRPEIDVNYGIDDGEQEAELPF